MARACVCLRVCARETLREKKNRLRTFIPSDPRSQDTIAQYTSRTSTENNIRSNTSSCSFLVCVLWIPRLLCGSTNTEGPASRATAQNKKKQAGSGNRARGRVGLAPSLFQSGMTMFRGPRIARISSSVRQGREESSRGGTQKREASRGAPRSACAFHSAKRGAKFGASCARTHPS